MRTLLAGLLFVHGVAHLPGFLVPWRLGSFPEMPYSTTILGHALDVGPSWIRMIGVLWLIVGLGFALAGAGVLAHLPWSFALVAGATGMSIVLCLVGWPESRIGVLVNLGLAGLLLAVWHLGRKPW